jgi:ribosomal protein L7/L12
MFDFISNLLGLGGDETAPTGPSAYGDRGTDRSAGATGPLVRLVKTGPKKIHVIKALREATGAGLAVAKAWADAPPVEVRTTDALSAEALIAAVADAGGVAEPFEETLPGPPPLPTDVAESYTVTLQLNGVDAIRAIKVVREHTGLGLLESKQHVDRARAGLARLGPYPRESALALMMALNELGAVAELE